MTLSRPASRLVLVGAILCAMLGPVGAPGAAAAPEGTLTIAMHFSPVTPYLLLYALHDGLIKPMPVQGWLQAAGIRTRLRSMERGAFMTSWC
jgi:hypothetical protein